MIAEIFPSEAAGKITAPPSKSAAHRALICGALSDESVISNLSFSSDIKATLGCLKCLGANIEYLSDNTVKIGGLNPYLSDSASLDCLESGSTLRFIFPLCLFSGKKFTIKASKKLLSRPMDVYADICKNQNISFSESDVISVSGNLLPDRFIIDAGKSSQFVSGLMFALPLLKKDSCISLTKNSESLSYIDITFDILKKFGIKAEKSDSYNYKIYGNQHYNNLVYSVEGDFSNSAFLDAFNLVGGNVEVKGLDPNSFQGDKIYKKYFSLIKSGSPIISLKDSPDLAPILFTLAAMYNGAEFVDTFRLKYKESDRALVMRDELTKFGADIKVLKNKVVIKKSNLHAPNVMLDSHNDHRVAMSLSVIASVYSGKIYNSESVNKSYPEFFDVIKNLGITVNINES